jgi:hypothetical protein
MKATKFSLPSVEELVEFIEGFYYLQTWGAIAVRWFSVGNAPLG